MSNAKLLGLALGALALGCAAHALAAPAQSAPRAAAPSSPSARFDTRGAGQTMTFGPFGQVAIYKSAPEPSNFLIFISGDGGWNLGVVDMAKELSTLDATVVGVDITHYLRVAQTAPGASFYAASDFQNLAQAVQKRLGFTRYHRPILAGFSSGATLVYGVLGQSPAGIFSGGLGLGFCPDLKTQKPLSKGSGLSAVADPKLGFIYQPMTLKAPFLALQGGQDETCLPAATNAFATQTSGMAVINLPKVGHGFSVPANWMPQLRTAFSRLAADTTPAQARLASGAPATSISISAALDLPLTIVPATGPARQTFAVMFSGDGGWSGLDQEMADGLARRGIPVVGWNSLSYFWTKRTPEEAASALNTVIEHYATAWSRPQVTLVGYSFGADPLPFLVNRLPPATRAKVRLVTLMGPEGTAEFEFQPGDWLGVSGASLPTKPEIARMIGVKLLCVYGADETDSLCPTLPRAEAEALTMPGGHHFSGKYDDIAAAVSARS
jgi:type IV secretory pathway VirJ component